MILGHLTEYFYKNAEYMAKSAELYAKSTECFAKCTEYMAKIQKTWPIPGNFLPHRGVTTRGSIVLFGMEI